MAFATPAELASFLQQDVDSATAQQALDLATQRIIQVTGQLFAVGTSTVELAGNEEKILLPQRPVTAVSSVQVGYKYGTFWDWAVDHDYFVQQGMLVSIWRWFPDRVKVTFTYGYATVPLDVKDCCLALAAERYSNPEGFTGEKIDDYQYTKPDTTTGPGSPAAMLLTELRGRYGTRTYVVDVQ